MQKLSEASLELKGVEDTLKASHDATKEIAKTNENQERRIKALERWREERTNKEGTMEDFYDD